MDVLARRKLDVKHFIGLCCERIFTDPCLSRTYEEQSYRCIYSNPINLRVQACVGVYVCACVCMCVCVVWCGVCVCVCDVVCVCVCVCVRVCV